MEAWNAGFAVQRWVVESYFGEDSGSNLVRGGQQTGDISLPRQMTSLWTVLVGANRVIWTVLTVRISGYVRRSIGARER